jgi:salicylate 5-hydroxylase large subunit
MTTDAIPSMKWPAQGATRIPYRVYTDEDIYRREQERIFQGDSWCYVGLEAEVPQPGNFKRSFVGEKSVIVTRDADGQVHVLENRCSHRGTQLCQQHRGTARTITCPYHQWAFNLAGDLQGVPFRRGVRQQGGMPADFDPAAHSLRKLKVAVRHGVIFASFSDAVEPLEDYLGEAMLALFDRVFAGRKLVVLGYSRQQTPANWKAMFENIKDPYHASLLHVFLVSFGLYRLDNPTRLFADATGRHAAAVSWRGEQKKTDANADIKSLQEHLKLHGSTMLQPVREFEQYTLAMLTIWPNLIVQQQSNTLAMRQLIPKGPGAYELAWTFFGYDTDDEEMVKRRLRQANLMGPGGYVSVDDSEVLKFVADGTRLSPELEGFVELGGAGWQQEEDHSVTESPIRAFYDHYRKVMEL